MATKEAFLTKLIASLFDEDELRRFVRFGPDGDDLSPLLPINVPQIHFATELVDLHRRRGLIDASFFDRLVDMRPKRASEIREAEKLWITEPGSKKPLTHEVPTSARRPEKAEDQSKQPLQVFVSYSHRDESFVEELASHLKLLQRQGIVQVWHDSEITAGEEWRDAIEDRLASADIILLLVSSNFLASDFCWSVELKQAMERHEKGTARVIPVFIRPSLWEDAPFAKLQGVPKDAKPIGSVRDTDRAWVEVAKAIRQTADQIRESRSQKGGA